MVIDRDTANRIAVLRPLLIFGVVLLHVPGQVDKPSRMGLGWFDWFSGFFEIGLFRGTVPTLSLIAGFLLFRAGLDLAPGALYRKKARTLLVPFLVFNVGLVMLVALLQSCFHLVFLRDLLRGAAHDWINALAGVKAVPLNYPLYFLRDLIVLVALAPVLGWLLRRRPRTGMVLVGLVFGLGLDGWLVLRDASAVMFYLGGWLALAQGELTAADRWALPCAAALCLLCVATMVLRLDDNTCLVYAAPFLIWPAVSLLKGTALWAWALRTSRYSFFVFLAHAPLLELLYQGWLALHPYAAIPYELFWVAAPLLTIAVLIALYHAALRMAPRAFNAAIGARARLGERMAAPSGDSTALTRSS
jgi:succinoglycan biosynthesis protein ExoH